MDTRTEFHHNREDNRDLTTPVLEGMSEEEISTLVHELWMRRLEVEGENEELRKGQAQLESLQRNYADFFEMAPVGYCLFDRDGLVLDVNQALTRQLGVEKTTLLNTRFDQYIAKADQKTFFQHLKTVCAAKIRKTCDITLQTVKGAQIPVRLESNIRQEDEASGIQCRTILVDVTESKRKEAALQRQHGRLEGLVAQHSRQLNDTTQQLQQETAERQRVRQALQSREQQYRLLAEYVTDGIGIIQNDRLCFVNKSFSTTFRKVPEFLLETKPAQLVNTSDRERFRQLLTHLPHDEPPKRFELSCPHENGQDMWIEGELIRIEGEEQPAILMTVRDITERKIKDVALEEERTRLSKELTTLKSSLKDRFRFGEIIGKSDAMQRVYEQIVKAASADSNVFIYGESGTGKELVARTIHNMSKRRDQRFIPVNCGAIPETLFESEFFGHRKGSFTGAFRDKQGFFSAAHNGTLFLDELGELPPMMQVKLLRVLDDGEYTPVGDTGVKKVDVRIIAATNRNLEDLRKRELLREDFFFRIHVFAIPTPPLRERKEDIPLLINHFLERYSSGEPFPMIPTHILEIFYAYHWPGNVREFQNALQRYLSDQPLNLMNGGNDAQVASGYVEESHSAQEGQEFHEVMDEFEKKLILNVLEQHRWNKSKTAAVLGIPRRTLYRKMEKYGIA